MNHHPHIGRDTWRERARRWKANAVLLAIIVAWFIVALIMVILMTDYLYGRKP